MMKCPDCNNDLLLSERQGVEIDYCPACRGIWLDKGELDKIIERSAIIERSSAESYPVDYGRDFRKEDAYRGGHHDDDHGHDSHHGDDHDYYIDPRTGKRKRRGGPLGFLGDLFD
jgi:hypothetical protein